MKILILLLLLPLTTLADSSSSNDIYPFLRQQTRDRIEDNNRLIEQSNAQMQRRIDEIRRQEEQDQTNRRLDEIERRQRR